MKILIVVTSVPNYLSHNIPTGLWLSEVTHLYDECKKNNVDINFASPKGGQTPIDPESLKPLVLDKVTKQYQTDVPFTTLLNNTKALSEIDSNLYDAIYLSGGHGTMYDFVGNETLNKLIKDFYESGKLVSAVCHGVCGLIDVKLSNGEYLIRDKKLTGYSWFEEIIARRKKQVPFNLERIIKERKGLYDKAFFPLTSKVVIDKSLITGQNPFSSKEIAKTVVIQLKNEK